MSSKKTAGRTGSRTGKGTPKAGKSGKASGKTTSRKRAEVTLPPARAKVASSKKTSRALVKAGAARGVAELRVQELESLRQELEAKRAELVPRWNADPDDVQKSVAQLVLALVEFLRKLLERQAIRRMDADTLRPDEVERIGLALMRLEETVHSLAGQFGLSPEELNLDLGPLGRLT